MQMQRTVRPLLALAMAACLWSQPLRSEDAMQPPPTSPAKVNINSADATELQTLKGIGPSLANRIVEYRKSYGPFLKVEELMNVRGIGEKSFLKLRDHITVGEVKPEGS